MRNAMIAASVMLAIFLAWPMVFGHRDSNSAAASMEERHIIPVAEAAESRLPRTAAAPPAPESCYRHYRRAVAACDADAAACKMRAVDRWDLCEATGLWPS